MVSPHKPEVEEVEVLFIQEVSVAVDSSLLLEGVVVPEKRPHHLQLVVQLAQVVHQVAVANLVEQMVVMEPMPVVVMLDMVVLDGIHGVEVIAQASNSMGETVVIMVDLVVVEAVMMVVVVPVATLAVLVGKMVATTAVVAVPIIQEQTRIMRAA
tara:strand:+ start:264 stop:728 length:465 start_codon:yes stop_codon:yes gene_type:complete